MITPVYSLPPEILARIFTKAICHCARAIVYSGDDAPPVSSPVTLAAVCRQWRKIVFSHQPLWVHLDLPVCRLDTKFGYPSPTFWQKNSHGAPLSVNVSQSLSFSSIPTYDEYGEPVWPEDDEHHPAPMVTRLLDFLFPFMRQIASLTLNLNWPAPYIFEQILSQWAVFCSPGQPSVLKVYADSRFPLNKINYLSGGERLGSLATLYLHNAAPDWSSWSLHCLTDFRLRNDTADDWSITQLQLQSVLVECPNLQFLMIRGVTVLRSQTLVRSPAILHHLKVLELHPFATLLLEYLFAIIDSRDAPLCLNILLDPDFSDLQDIVTVIHRFMSRSNVTTFQLSAGRIPCFASQIAPLPRVETLILHGCYLIDTATILQYPRDPKVYVNPSPLSPGFVLWPKLRHVYLQNCVLDKDYICRLFSSHSVQELFMQNCDDRLRFDKSLYIKPQLPEAYMRSLSQIVARVRCLPSQSDEWPDLFLN